MKYKVRKISFLSLILIVTVQCTNRNSTQSRPEIKAESTLLTINEKPQYLGDSILGVRKIKDIVIYKDSLFFSTFPSVITRADGEVLVAFRRAPDRKIFGEPKTDHVDPNSYLVMVRSGDNGETWTQNPELIYSHPFGGSQDPCLLQLKDETLLCASYGWAFIDQLLYQI